METQCEYLWRRTLKKKKTVFIFIFNNNNLYIYPM